MLEGVLNGKVTKSLKSVDWHKEGKLFRFSRNQLHNVYDIEQMCMT
jgi:hypothetical protein